MHPHSPPSKCTCQQVTSSAGHRNSMLPGLNNVTSTSTNGTSIGNRTVRQESCSIKEATEILLAGETRITVTPEAEAAPAVRPAERRGSERRTHDRRESSVVVRLDRRDPDNRRGGSRRE